jgi:hypothetical protein
VAENPDIAPGLNIIFNTLEAIQGTHRLEEAGHV